jgi:hypothetical protein
VEVHAEFVASNNRRASRQVIRPAQLDKAIK